MVIFPVPTVSMRAIRSQLIVQLCTSCSWFEQSVSKQRSFFSKLDLSSHSSSLWNSLIKSSFVGIFFIRKAHTIQTKMTKMMCVRFPNFERLKHFLLPFAAFYFVLWSWQEHFLVGFSLDQSTFYFILENERLLIEQQKDLCCWQLTAFAQKSVRERMFQSCAQEDKETAPVGHTLAGN